MAIDQTAAEGFGRAAAAYERGRPSYPNDAVEWMVTRLGITRGATVIDLGAGTGKFTRMLLRTGARVIAVEPVAAMRSELIRVWRPWPTISGWRSPTRSGGWRQEQHGSTCPMSPTSFSMPG